MATHQSVYLGNHADQTLILLTRMRHIHGFLHVISNSRRCWPRVRVAVIVVPLGFHPIDQMNPLKLPRDINVVLIGAAIPTYASTLVAHSYSTNFIIL